MLDVPIGTAIERASDKVWPGGWIDATGFDTYYNATGAWCYHTGVDLNLNVPTFDADKDSPVYAIADGLVVYAQLNTVWGIGNAIIVIKHVLPDNTILWSRYAHVENIKVMVGHIVSKGEQIAQIGNAAGRYPYHLHFDIATIDLGASPGDWPGTDNVRLLKDYLDPLLTIQKYHSNEVISVTTNEYIVLGDQHVHVRAAPNQTSQILAMVPTGKHVTGVVENDWVKIGISFVTPFLVDTDNPGNVPAYGYMLGALLKPVLTTPVPVPTNTRWNAKFFLGTAMAGVPVFTTEYDTVNFNWGLGSPNQAVPIEKWSAIFERTITYDTNAERLWTVTADDGVRFYLDDVLVINAWREQPATPYVYRGIPAAGPHKERIEYFEQGGQASLVFSSEIAPPPILPAPAGQFKAEHGLHMMFGWGRGDDAIKYGCTNFVWLDDYDSARRACDALEKTSVWDGKGTVGFRKWWNGVWPTQDQVMTELHIGQDNRIISIPTNECEFVPKQGLEAITFHTSWDIQMAEMAARVGATVALGTYAVGNPNICDWRVVQALKNGYSNWWNTFEARTGIKPCWDQHQYWPNWDEGFSNWEGDIAFQVEQPPSTVTVEYIMAQQPYMEKIGRNKTEVWRFPQSNQMNLMSGGAPTPGSKTVHIYEQNWYSSRVAFLILLCGFDITKGVYWCSESGMDVGGKGGFPGNGKGSADVIAWAARENIIWERPVTDDYGHTARIPHAGHAIFMAGESAQWASYSVKSMIQDLAPMWRS